MAISDEMKEAIRILREDGQMAAFNKMTRSQQEMIERFDEVENNWSEFRAAQEAKETTPVKQEESGTTGITPPVTPNTPETPQPPPVKTEEPVLEKKGRTPWWERGGYDTGS